MATRNGTKKPETEKQRRQRHGQVLSEAWFNGPARNWQEALERVMRATAYAVVPGKQKRDSDYMIEIRELAFRSAKRSLLRRRGSR